MHSCGNLYHDIPLYIVYLLGSIPFVTPFFWWFVSKVQTTSKTES